jgi:hypothetical protein
MCNCLLQANEDDFIFGIRIKMNSDKHNEPFPTTNNQMKMCQIDFYISIDAKGEHKRNIHETYTHAHTQKEDTSQCIPRHKPRPWSDSSFSSTNCKAMESFSHLFNNITKTRN